MKIETKMCLKTQSQSEITPHALFTHTYANSHNTNLIEENPPHYNQIVLTVLTSTIKYNEYVTDKGENISIPCIADGNIMWVKENGSNNSTIVQTGKYLVLTNVSASDGGVYVCFAAVTSSRSQHYDGDDDDDDDDHNETNSTSIVNESGRQFVDEQREGQAQDEHNTGRDGRGNVQQNNERTNEQVLLTSTTIKTNHTNETFVTPLIETTKNIHTQNASTTSMLPMPTAVTATATTATSLRNTKSNSILNVSASASASASATTTPTTILIKSSSSKVKSSTTTNEAIYHSISRSNITSSSSSESYNNNSNNSFTTSTTTTTIDNIEEQEFQAFQKINLTVRTPPGPVTKLYFKASTILGFLIWRFNKTNSGGYPVRSFTAEFRNVSYASPPYNSSFEHEWSRMDPINIAPNVRQMEVYRLEPNTTYEFRIWANNQLGSGEVVTTNVTTLPETKEEDLIRLIQPDLDNFDPRIWIVAVSIVLGTFVILAIGLCIVLTKECYQSSQAEFEDGWDSIELIPNIILNPGFCEADGRPAAPRTVIFGGDDDSDDSCESESDHEPRMQKFKRKLSVFFTDPTIYRSHI